MNLSLRDKSVLVVGLARSGVAAANLLLAQGARVKVTDLRPAGSLSDPLSQLKGPVDSTLGQHLLSDFLNADLIVVSPGVPSHQSCLQEAIRSKVPVWAEVELGYRFLKGRFVGITGSNGKTTTTTLVGELFRTAGVAVEVAGNIGRPLTEVAAMGQQCRQFVLELSSFQLEHVHELHCQTAAILNLTADHLDRHSSFEAYLDAKVRIFNRQSGEDYAVLNGDDPALRGVGEHRASQTVLFSRRRQLEPGACLSPDGWVTWNWQGQTERILPAADIRLKGLHNLENVLAATAIGRLSGLDMTAMADCFRSFSGVEHRLEYVAEVSQVEFFNDSKATNVDSAVKALEAFAQPLIVIFGGRDKGGSFQPLRPLIEAKARGVLLIGEATPKLQAALHGAAPIELCPSLESAVREAFRMARPGDAILLAPACASFDMFENFEHRGRVFKSAVASLKQEREGVSP